jgi:PKD repeat protein
MRKTYKLVKTLSLIVLTAFLLSFSVSQAQAQTSYIIVHAFNPEGIEIASIEGMDPYCVQIYDGETLIGYGAHDNETYNKPIATSPGAHTIKAKFNAMTLEQSINLEPGEMKVLVFMFSRTTFNLIEKIGNCSIESSISGEWSGHSSKIYDTKICSNNSGWKTETHFWEPCNYRSGVYDLKARLSFQISENDISWSNYVYADIDESTYAVCPSSYYPNTTPYWHAVASATNSEGIELDTFSPDFDNWYLQYTNFCEGVSLKIDGIEYLEIQGDYLVKTISANQNSFLNLAWGKYLSVTGGNAHHYFYGGRLHMWNEFEESGGGPFRMLMSSVPYDLTGTGIKYEATQPPVASFVYSPEEPVVGEEITFDASSSYDPDGTVVKYEWDFGDGNTAEGVEVTHTYAEAGEYTVTLTITDNDGLTGSAELSFIVKLVIVMTFDDGPVGDIALERGNYTEDILNDLYANDIQSDIKAVFFVQTHAPEAGGSPIGEELIKGEDRYGHVVAVHTGGKAKHRFWPWSLLDRHPKRAQYPPYDIDMLFDYNGDGINDSDGIPDGKNALESDLIAAKKRIELLTGKVPEFVRPPYYDYGKTPEEKQRVLATYQKQYLKMILTDAKGQETGSSFWSPGWWIAWRLNDTVEEAIEKHGINQVVVTLHDTNEDVAEYLIFPGFFHGSLLDAIVEGVREGLGLETREEALECTQFITSGEEIPQILRSKEEWGCEK